MSHKEEQTPRWGTVTAAVLLAIAVLVVVVIVTGRGGDHGPQRHSSPAGAQMQR